MTSTVDMKTDFENDQIVFKSMRKENSCLRKQIGENSSKII